jgi:hypothetical protein
VPSLIIALRDRRGAPVDELAAQLYTTPEAIKQAATESAELLLSPPPELVLLRGMHRVHRSTPALWRDWRDLAGLGLGVVTGVLASVASDTAVPQLDHRPGRLAAQRQGE